MKKSSQLIKDVVIVGGGAAGWWTAGFLSCKNPELNITLVDTDKVHPIGVGESMLPLIKEFFNIDISKQFQSSDFGGELTPAQLKYCANDVIYLHRIHDELKKILERENRMQLYEDCLKC